MNKEIKIDVDLKTLANHLNTTDIAMILLHQANRDCNLSSSQEDLQNFQNQSLYILRSLNDDLKKLKKGFIFRVALEDEYFARNKNIGDLLKLMEEPDGIKRSYLQINYYAVEHLNEAGLIKISDEKDYHKQVLTPQKGLYDLINPLLDENKCGDFKLINDTLVAYLANSLHNEDLKIEKDY